MKNPTSRSPWGYLPEGNGREDVPPYQVLWKLITPSDSRCPYQREARRLQVKLTWKSAQAKLAELREQRRKINYDIFRAHSARVRSRLKMKAELIAREMQIAERLSAFLKAANRKSLVGAKMELIQRRNSNVFFKRRGYIELLKRGKFIEKRSEVWFHPNEIAMDWIHPGGGRPSFPVSAKTLKGEGRLKIHRLWFLFADIDNAGSEADLYVRLSRVPFSPSVIVQSSKFPKYHVYWAIQPLNVSEDEDLRGFQTDPILERYHHVQAALVALLGADQSKIGAQSGITPV